MGLGALATVGGIPEVAAVDGDGGGGEANDGSGGSTGRVGADVSMAATPCCKGAGATLLSVSRCSCAACVSAVAKSRTLVKRPLGSVASVRKTTSSTADGMLFT